MKLAVNVPNFGPGTDPDTLLRWAQLVETLGYDLLMLSDHIVVTRDVAEQYPAPFYEPFTTLAWLAGATSRIRLGTSVLIVPYRHPLLVARMAANLNQLSKRGLVLGVGVGWARQEFAALGVSHEQRGRLTDEHLRAIRLAWTDVADYGAGHLPIWVGGNGVAGMQRAIRLGEAWHPLRPTIGWLDTAQLRITALADELQRPVPALAPRIALRLTDTPLSDGTRLAGEGTVAQVLDDLDHLRQLGADTVVLDPFDSDPEETHRPEVAWRALTAVAEAWNETDPLTTEERTHDTR